MLEIAVLWPHRDVLTLQGLTGTPRDQLKGAQAMNMFSHPFLSFLLVLSLSLLLSFTPLLSQIFPFINSSHSIMLYISA